METEPINPYKDEITQTKEEHIIEIARELERNARQRIYLLQLLEELQRPNE
jgi:hypothetical protein